MFSVKIKNKNIPLDKYTLVEYEIGQQVGRPTIDRFFFFFIIYLYIYVYVYIITNLNTSSRYSRKIKN